MAAIEQKDVPTMMVASIRKDQPKGQIFAFISASAIQMMVYLKELGIGIAGRGFTVHHDDKAESIDIAACFPVSHSGQDRGDIKFHELAGGKAVCVNVKGISYY